MKLSDCIEWLKLSDFFFKKINLEGEKKRGREGGKIKLDWKPGHFSSLYAELGVAISAVLLISTYACIT